METGAGKHQDVHHRCCEGEDLSTHRMGSGYQQLLALCGVLYQACAGTFGQRLPGKTLTGSSLFRLCFTFAARLSAHHK